MRLLANIRSVRHTCLWLWVSTVSDVDMMAVWMRSSMQCSAVQCSAQLGPLLCCAGAWCSRLARHLRRRALPHTAGLRECMFAFRGAAWVRMQLWCSGPRHCPSFPRDLV